MRPRFSLVYPTRDRPAFIGQALRAMRAAGAFDRDDVEVVVCDNPSDPAMACERVCQAADAPNLHYIRPASPLGMVGNWSEALQHAKGDYLSFFTDRMFLMPWTLDALQRAVDDGAPDIVGWGINSYAAAGEDPFGPGTYHLMAPHDGLANGIAYEPRAALDYKLRADRGRQDMPAVEYWRGKVCFGAYSRSLCERIVAQAGRVFHPISPDYTSMILALSNARSAVQLPMAGGVSAESHLSNGLQTALGDEACWRFLGTVGDPSALAEGMLVPGLYASNHNLVSHDYLSMQRRFGIDAELDQRNWLVYIREDLDLPGRVWSSPEAERKMRGLFERHLSLQPPDVRSSVRLRLARRRAMRWGLALRRRARVIGQRLLPEAALNRARRSMGIVAQARLGSIEQALQAEV